MARAGGGSGSSQRTDRVSVGARRGVPASALRDTHPDFPDSLAIIAVSADGTYTQHYFDSRGVVRVYSMRYTDDLWTLVHDAPDFTPLSFAQRFTAVPGRGQHDRRVWDTSTDGAGWEHDFDLIHTRVM